MVGQGKRQLLYARTKGELRTGGGAPSLNHGGGAIAPNGKSASCFEGALRGGGWMGGYEKIIMVPQGEQNNTRMGNASCVHGETVQTGGLFSVKMLQQKDAAGRLPDAVTIVTMLHFLPTAQ